MKLQYPFDYYWKKYNEGKCPFCNDSEINYMENLDVIYCSIYGGYLSISQDDVFAGPEGKGECKTCVPPYSLEGKGDEFVKEVEETSFYREVARGPGFL